MSTAVASLPSPLPAHAPHFVMHERDTNLQAASELGAGAGDEQAPDGQALQGKRKAPASAPRGDTEQDAPVSVTPAKKAKTATGLSPAAPLAKAKSLVTLKGTKLTLKQKALGPSKPMSTLMAIVQLNAHLKSCTAPLDSVPAEHLPLIAQLTQESDKTLAELAKAIKNDVVPPTDEDSQSQSAGEEAAPSASDMLPIPVLQAAVEAVAQRVNYGVDASLSDEALPAGLQLWRWEVQDSSLLASEVSEKLLTRRAERETARLEVQTLLDGLSEGDRSALLASKKRGRAAAPAENASATASSSSGPMELDEKPAAAAQAGLGENAASSSVSEATPGGSAGPAALRSITIDLTSEASGSRARSPTRKSPEREEEEVKEKQPRKPKKLSAEALEKKLEREEKKREAERKKAERAERVAEKAAKLQKEESNKAKAASFMSSFIRRDRSASPSKGERDSLLKGRSDFDRVFLPCEFKDVAPINRFARPAPGDLLRVIGCGEPSHEDILASLAPGSSRGESSAAPSSSRRSRPRTRKGVHPPVCVRESVRIINEAGLFGGNAEEEAYKASKDLADPKKVQVKLLQFESDRRPAWFGTWTRTSNLVGPRNPFGQDSVALDYSYDSDNEWEEPGEGEDCQDVDEREEEEPYSASEQDSDLDDFLENDLEEIDADDAGSDIVETDAAGMPLKRRSVSPFKQLGGLGTGAGSALSSPFGKGGPNVLTAKKKKKIKPLGRRFDAKLVPFSTGPHWETSLGVPAYDNFKPYQIEFLNGACAGLNPFTYVSPTFKAAPVPADSSTSNTNGSSSSTPAPVAKTPASTKHTSIKMFLEGGSPSKHSAAAVAESAGASDSAMTNAASTSASTPAKRDGPKAVFPETRLRDLLLAIEGRAHSKPFMLEYLKGMFDGPGITKGSIEVVLNQYAHREGKKTTSKWLINAEYRHLLD